MTKYLSYQFEDTPDFVNTFDELPFWSAPFGLLMFKYLELKQNINVVDIGSGAGFPLLELASRLGETCKVYGIDPWKNANNRVEAKIKNYGIGNVEIIESSAEKMTFFDHSIDLIVSNLGINNFEKPDEVFKECCRVLKPNGRLVLTTNLNGHWNEFYTIFEATLRQLGREDLVNKLIEHQKHRGSISSISTLFDQNGFEVRTHHEESFQMKFVDGTTFLNHHFIKMGWLGSWKELLKPADLEEIFTLLEKKANSFSESHNGLTLTVPMAYFEGVKTQ